MDHLPLRGFLNCPNSNRKLTGSASKGRHNYYYYHCSTKCRTRFKANAVNEVFEQQLDKLIPKPAVLELRRNLIREEVKSIANEGTNERRQRMKDLDEANARLQKARLMRIDGDLGEDDFQAVKTQTLDRIEVLEERLSECATVAMRSKALSTAPYSGW